MIYLILYFVCGIVASAIFFVFDKKQSWDTEPVLTGILAVAWPLVLIALLFVGFCFMVCGVGKLLTSGYEQLYNLSSNNLKFPKLSFTISPLMTKEQFCEANELKDNTISQKYYDYFVQGYELKFKDIMQYFISNKKILMTVGAIILMILVNPLFSMGLSFAGFIAAIASAALILFGVLGNN